ncbi:hypothetical protein MSAN_00110800 [Mycena sanguinolenta]|uniref:Uncharacterized protein n=1 Tax=Mycena sanguinolenta TaxID=230812 RepID=A0A8H7DJX2_9AGAR|nr:hypothetical protein MSAN_00110800 [Mycena sanguinolenta]
MPQALPPNQTRHGYISVCLSAASLQLDCDFAVGRGRQALTSGISALNPPLSAARPSHTHPADHNDHAGSTHLDPIHAAPNTGLVASMAWNELCVCQPYVMLIRRNYHGPCPRMARFSRVVDLRVSIFVHFFSG